VPWVYKFTATAQQQLEALGHAPAAKIIAHLDKRIASGAHPKQWADPYRRELHGFWKIRVGDYRLVARLHEQVLLIELVKIGHRRDVYE
jgi:mRNA interferase RelE/StbE